MVTSKDFTPLRSRRSRKEKSLDSLCGRTISLQEFIVRRGIFVLREDRREAWETSGTQRVSLSRCCGRQAESMVSMLEVQVYGRKQASFKLCRTGKLPQFCPVSSLDTSFNEAIKCVRLLRLMDLMKVMRNASLPYMSNL